MEYWTPHSDNEFRPNTVLLYNKVTLSWHKNVTKYMGMSLFTGGGAEEQLVQREYTYVVPKIV